MGFIAIDFDQLVLVAVFAFAAIGLSRGWLTELINTVLLVLLSILLLKPDMLEPILEKVNKFLMILLAWLRTGFSLDLGELGKTIDTMEDVIDPGNPYPILLILTIALLAMQYAGTRIKLTGELTPFSRILGAILGAVNANIVISLVKQLILENSNAQKRIVEQASLKAATSEQVAAASAAAAELNVQMQGAQTLAPKGIAMALDNVPSTFLPESYWIWIGGAVVVIALVLLASHFTDKPIGKQ